MDTSDHLLQIIRNPKTLRFLHKHKHQTFRQLISPKQNHRSSLLLQLLNLLKRTLESTEMELQISLILYSRYLKQFRNLKTKFKNITISFSLIKIINSKLIRQINKVKMLDKLILNSFLKTKNK